MSKSAKIVLYILGAIIVAALLGSAVFAFWARPGRLSDSECRELVRMAWQRGQEGVLAGERVFIYRMGDREYRVKTEPEAEERFPRIQSAIADLFPQAEPDDGFFEGLKIEHAGRIRVAGKTCERIRLSPTEYIGDSLMLWIDPGTGYLLSWRRFDFNRSLIRGYRYDRVDYSSETAPEIPENQGIEGNDEPGWQFLGAPQLLTEDEINEMAAGRPVAIPSWLPPGFAMVGGRMVNSLEPPGGFEGVFPGMGPGRLRREAGNMPGPFQGIGQGQLQLIFSDGLNTVTMVQFHPQQNFGAGLDPGRAQGILDAKALEVERVFHVSMCAKVLSGGIVVLFGGVAPDVLKQIADSIPELEFEPGMGGPPFMGPPEDSMGGPWFGRPGGPGGPGRRGGAGPGPGGGNRPPAQGPE